MKNYTIKVTDSVTVTMTGKQLADFHNRLTMMYNENFEAITNEDNDE